MRRLRGLCLPGTTGGRSGTTLVEMMVALFIFALFAAGMAELLVKTRETSDLARDHYIAINLCKNRIERARAYAVEHFEQLPQFNESNTLINENGEAGTRFRRSTSIVSRGTNFMEMTITVEIGNRNTLTFTGEGETVNTYIANLKGPPE